MIDENIALDVKYLGMSITIPTWRVLILAPPPIAEMAGVAMPDHTQHAMIKSANYGMILSIGKRAFESWEVDGQPAECPFKVGDWVMFEAMHPEARTYNGQLTYSINDITTMYSISQEELEYWDTYLLFKDGLAEIENKMKVWRSMTFEERKETAGNLLYQMASQLEAAKKITH